MEKINRFLRQEKGGLALIFAIILPFLFSCCALVFDGAKLLSKRARLADALNEAALAVATASSVAPDPAEKTKLKTLLSNYVTAYLPGDTIKNSDIIVSYTNDPDTGAKLPVFDLRAQVDIKTMLPLDKVPAFTPTIDMSNNGKVRKGLGDIGRPADYVFVVDFSNSMNQGSAQPGLTRLELLKKVVNDITEKALEAFPETTFTLVPFDSGVLTKYPNRAAPKNNQLGGATNGCSALMVPNNVWHSNLNMEVGYNIDFDFWANKLGGLSTLPAPSASSSDLPYSLEKALSVINYYRYIYYRDYVLASLKRTTPSANWDTLVTKGLCHENDKDNEDPLSLSPRAPYTCQADASDNIYLAPNKQKIKDEMERARRYATTYQNTYSIVNIDAINIVATMDGMFDANNIITFPLLSWRNNPYSQTMCYSAATSAGTANTLDKVEPNAYLIEPTSDRSVLAEFQTMQARGNTLSSAGLLRAVPEMVKGTNPRTVAIVISDGDDNDNYVLDALHKNRPNGDRVCDRIRNKLKDYKPGTQEVEIYFISVVNDSSGQSRTNYWGTYCTGPDNAIIATNYDDIMSKLIEIMNKYEETGYFYN